MRHETKLSVITFALFLTFLQPGCEKPSLQEPETVEAEAPETAFPFFYTLTDSRGRSVKAEVLGRDTRTVTFVRWSDKKRFTLALNELSPADQTYLLQLPITAPRPPDIERSSANKRDSNRAKGSSYELTGYAKIIQGRIVETDKKIDDIKEEMYDTEHGTIRWRTLTKRRQDLESDLIDLRGELNENR